MVVVACFAFASFCFRLPHRASCAPTHAGAHYARFGVEWSKRSTWPTLHNQPYAPLLASREEDTIDTPALHKSLISPSFFSDLFPGTDASVIAGVMIAILLVVGIPLAIFFIYVEPNGRKGIPLELGNKSVLETYVWPTEPPRTPCDCVLVYGGRNQERRI